MKTMRTVTRILAAVAVIALIVGLVMAGKKQKANAHDIDDISVQITSMQSKREQSSYRYDTFKVSFDVKIENGTKAELSSISMTFAFCNAAGKTVGTMSSSFGNPYSSDFRLDAGKSVTLGTYLSENGADTSSLSGLVGELYGASLSDFTVTCTVTQVTFTDGYSA